MRARGLVILLCGALGACTSTYVGTKLGEDGALTGAAGQTGLPYLLTRPKFQVSKDDKSVYSVAIAYVPDPTQRYSIRMNPALFADTGFKINWGDGGALTGLTGSVTDQSISTFVAVLKMTADVAGAIAAPLGAGKGAGAGASVNSGCLGSGAVSTVLSCVLSAPNAPASCSAAVVADLLPRLRFFTDENQEDKGDVLASLYATSVAQATCLTDAAEVVTANASNAMTAEPPAVAPVPPNPPAVVGLMPLARDAFTKQLATTNGAMSPLAAPAQAALITDVASDRLVDLRKLMTGVKRYPTDPSYLYGLLNVQPCAPPAPAPPVGNPALTPNTALPAPAAASCDADKAVIGALKIAFAAAALDGKPPAKRIELIARGSKIAKALKAAAALPPDVWTARRIADLDREEAAAVQVALMAAPGADPEQSKSVTDIRTFKAATVGLAPEYVRLRSIRKRLDDLPKQDSTGRLSPASEYGALRDEGDRLDKLLAARLTATQTATKDDTKPEVFAPEAPWVAAHCVTDSANLVDWSYAEGADAPDYVIIIRRAGGARAAIDPVIGKGSKPKECGS